MNVNEVIDLARKHSTANSSSLLCFQDAMNLFMMRMEDAAKKRAIKSLKHSVGIFHDDYRKAIDAPVEYVVCLRASGKSASIPIVYKDKAEAIAQMVRYMEDGKSVSFSVEWA